MTLRPIRLAALAVSFAEAAIALSACATGPHERIVRSRFECEGGRRLDVSFNTTRQIALVKRSKAEPAELPSEHPASGMWYRGDGYELRGAGDTLNYTAPGAAKVKCEQVR